MRHGCPQRSHTTRCAVLLLALPLLAQQPDRAEEREPRDIGRIEQVEVQLVLLDVLVLDRRDRTVPALDAGDFEVRVDGAPVEIDSVDVDCPAGRTRDVRSGRRARRPIEAPGAGAPRRIVHAFDYYHMGLAVEALERARSAIRRLSGERDRQMVVSIGPGLRVEHPFTDDAASLDRALERMSEDPGLYAGHFGRLTDRRFYRKLEALIDFLELIEGPKVVVLYSGPFLRDGFDHDPDFKRIASMAARARVALYPVDSSGLRTPSGFTYGDLGGPKELARFAVETGGRVTYHTNDLGLALARAHRDLGCRYTISFRDRSPRPDHARRVGVWVRRSGLRAIHPAFYVIRSEQRQLDSRVRAAALVPEMFESGGMEVSVLGLRPHGPGSWDAVVDVALPDAVRTIGQDAPWRLEGRVTSPSGATLRRFRREIAPPTHPRELEGDAGRTLLEPLSIDPGSYRVNVVLHREGLDVPLAAHAEFELPPIPRDELFLVGPHVGRYTPGPSEEDATPPAGRDPAGWQFEPLRAGTVRRGTTLDALTWVCRVGETDTRGAAEVGRELAAVDGDTVGRFEAIAVELAGPRRIDCHALVDSIPTSSLRPGRYAVRARLSTAGRTAEVRFAVVD